jgi:hypothetical protein
VQTESYYDGLLYGANAAGYFLPGETVYIYGSRLFDFSDNEPSPITATGVFYYAYTFAADDHYSLTWNTPDYSDAQWSVGCSNDGTMPPPVNPEPTSTPSPTPTATVPQLSVGCQALNDPFYDQSTWSLSTWPTLAIGETVTIAAPYPIWVKFTGPATFDQQGATSYSYPITTAGEYLLEYSTVGQEDTPWDVSCGFSAP